MITERSGSVYALLPKGTDFAGTPLIPVFETKGTLTINGSPIQSGTTPVNFGEEVKLTVTSKNGLFTKEYTVLLQESGAVIYVDLRACGRNNGTSWEDAFISFDRAIEAANAIPADSVIEIYLTENDTPYTYDSDAYPLERANLIIRGGFTGNETTPEERIMRRAEDPIPLYNSQIIGTGNTYFLYGNGEKKPGELLVLDSLAISYGKCQGFIGLYFGSKDFTQLKLDIQNCHIKDDGNNEKKLEFLLRSFHRNNINISISDSEITYSSDAVRTSFRFLDPVYECTANLVIKNSNLTIPDLTARVLSFSNLEIYNSIIKNSKKDEPLEIASDNWEFHDSEFYGVTGGITGYHLTTETKGEYYNCYFHNVDDLPCTVMENCNFFNCREYDSVSGSIGLIRSPGNTRITNSSITAYPSSLGSNSVYLIDFLGLDINHSDRNIELTDCSVESFSNSSLIDSACNLTIRGSGSRIKTGTIFSERLYRDNTCNLIIEDASISAMKGFNVYNSGLTKQAFNKLKILDSHINSYGDFMLPLSNNTVIKNSTISSKTECKISYVDTDSLTKPENLEITGSTIQGSSILIGQGVNTVIKDNKITTPTDEYTYVKIYLSDNTDVCGLNNRNYEFQGNTIDSNETKISFNPPIENIKLNNNNFSNYTSIYTNENTAPDLFEFNGNSLNTTREITSSTGDIIDAYYQFDLRGLKGGTILYFENTNFSRFYLSSSSASATNKIYLNFKNCVMDSNIHRHTPNLVTLITPSDSCEALFLDCIFTSDTQFATTDAIFSIDGVNGIIKGNDSNTSIINAEHGNVIEASVRSRVDIQNTAINISVKSSEETMVYTPFEYCNFDNCTFNVSSEVKISTVFYRCNLSNSTFDGKNIYEVAEFIFNTNNYAGVCGKRGLTNCTITNVKAKNHLFYDFNIAGIDTSEIRSCSGSISTNDINNSRLFNYDCSEQNIDTITCYGNITDSSIYGWTTEFYGEKIQNSSFNSCITDKRGGAVKIATSTNSKGFLIENSRFSNCKSTETDPTWAGGGAIAIECYANNIGVTIRNCRFINNKTSSTEESKGWDIFMCARWKDGRSYSGCVLDLQNCYTDFLTKYGTLFGDAFTIHTKNITKKGNMQAL